MKAIRMTPIFLSDVDVRSLLKWPEVIGCLHTAYKNLEQPSSAPPRSNARLGSKWVRALPALPAGSRLMGAKIIARAETRGASHLIALWEQDTAALVCLIDGKSVTAMRTAGTSATAVDALAPHAPLRAAVLGSGHEAAAHIRAIAAVRQFSSVSIYSPTAEKCAIFATQFSGESGVPCTPCASARDAVTQADIVIAAARSHDESPILYGDWLKAGTTVVSIGSTLPEQRETDVSVIDRATRIFADVPDEVLHDSGDMIAARKEGIDAAQKTVSLADLLQGKCTGRINAQDILLFKSVGSGLQDIAVSAMCYEKALSLNVGLSLPMQMSGRPATGKPVT